MMLHGPVTLRSFFAAAVALCLVAPEAQALRTENFRSSSNVEDRRNEGIGDLVGNGAQLDKVMKFLVKTVKAQVQKQSPFQDKAYRALDQSSVAYFQECQNAVSAEKFLANTKPVVSSGGMGSSDACNGSQSTVLDMYGRAQAQAQQRLTNFKALFDKKNAAAKKAQDAVLFLNGGNAKVKSQLDTLFQKHQKLHKAIVSGLERELSNVTNQRTSVSSTFSRSNCGNAATRPTPSGKGSSGISAPLPSIREEDRDLGGGLYK